ncbi:hypothetical protein K440DRAFT_662229 [Wilcoxina mikolae CBS 423.85]|nr:hypothetical protein K440DRAFT_662229 [Wilcoxina mikolae CBS 423.85]
MRIFTPEYDSRIAAESLEMYCPGGYHPIYRRSLKRRDSPGRKHVLHHLLDSFYIVGPNGRHLCIVLDVVGPRLHCFLVPQRGPGVNYRLDVRCQVLVRFPELEHLDPEELVERLGPPVIGKVIQRDGGALGPGIPEYQVEPADVNLALKAQDLGDIQLTDLGEAFFIDNPPNHLSVPGPFHPPELVFRHNLSKAVDIWALGGTIYEVVLGNITLFQTYSEGHLDLIPQFNTIIGNMPPHWIPDALKNGIDILAEHLKNIEYSLPLEGDVKTRYFCRPLEGDVNPPYFFLPHEEYVKMHYFGDNDGQTRILTEDDVETLTK